MSGYGCCCPQRTVPLCKAFLHGIPPEMEHPAYLALEEAVTVLADWSAQVSAGATGGHHRPKVLHKDSVASGNSVCNAEVSKYW